MTCAKPFLRVAVNLEVSIATNVARTAGCIVCLYQPASLLPCCASPSRDLHCAAKYSANKTTDSTKYTGHCQVFADV